MPPDERLRVLSEIARDPDASARDRIAAVRALHDLQGDVPREDAFAELDNVAQIRRK